MEARTSAPRNASRADRQNDPVSQLLLEDLVRLESQVWQALVDGDADADRRMLSDDFLGVYPTGFADRESHVGQLLDGNVVRVARRATPGRVRLCRDPVVPGRIQAPNLYRAVADAERVCQLVVVPSGGSVDQRLQPGHAGRVVA